MIDGHIHIHKQPYNLDTIEKMVAVALDKGIDTLYILDHTHKFHEFDFMYQSLKEPLSIKYYQKNSDIRVSINEYINFIKEVKKHTYPVTLKFGLEVCYFKEQIAGFKSVINSLKPFEFDFLIGSIHHVDGAAVDLDKSIILNKDIDEYYHHYYESLEEMIKTRLFTFIAHPDLIKIFDIYPSYDLTETYEHLAMLLHEYDQETENNSGLIRFGYPYPGLSPELVKVFKKHHVRFHKSSDAHIYSDIGRAFDQLEENYK